MPLPTFSGKFSADKTLIKRRQQVPCGRSKPQQDKRALSACPGRSKQRAAHFPVFRSCSGRVYALYEYNNVR